jgi:hypothetical protein
MRVPEVVKVRVAQTWRLWYPVFMPQPTSKHSNPADLLRVSEKFLNWKPEEEPEKPLSVDDIGQSHIMAEKHYAPQELTDMWGVSVQTIREIFKDEDGVLKLGSDGTRNRRAYKTLRIPESVAERVHTRLSC